MDYKEQIKALLKDPEKLKTKRPFTRGADLDSESYMGVDTVNIGEVLSANLPNYKSKIISQEQFMRELDPNCHDVLFDENVPSLCVKAQDGEYYDIKFSKMPVSFQRNIKDKQLLHLTGNDMQFTIMDTNPDEGARRDFITFKQYWNLRNQDGMKNKMVDTQLSFGDAGLLYYFDYKGCIKSRILSYADGYVLCPHNDQNGDRILESVYYQKDNVEYIDSYDDTYMYRWTNTQVTADPTLGIPSEKSGWKWATPIKHGFEEIPLITKRGEVAWNNVQHIITSYEILYNIFNAIQRRHGWGLLYIRGKFKDQARKIAGSVVLNDSSLDGKGDAKFLTPPSPQGTIDTLELMLDTIQLNSSTTFILPKDIKMSGDISGIAIMLTQSQDIENALQRVIEWQNVADKMTRLFKYGLAKELVKKGIQKTAVTDFEKLNVNAKFKVWRPMNDVEYNQMLATLTGAGLLSQETGIEKNTVSTPDEKERIKKEAQDMLVQMQKELAAQKRDKANKQNKPVEEE